MILELRFDPHVGAASVKTTRAHTGSLLDFLQVTTKLNSLPSLWLFRGITVVVNFETGQLTLTVPAGWGKNDQQITATVPLTELCQLSSSEFQKKHVWPYAATIAAQCFKMPQTARAIRRGAQNHTVKRWMNEEYKDKITDEDLWNLLFATEWTLNSKYTEITPGTGTIWDQVILEN